MMQLTCESVYLIQNPHKHMMLMRAMRSVVVATVAGLGFYMVGSAFYILTRRPK